MRTPCYRGRDCSALKAIVALRAPRAGGTLISEQWPIAILRAQRGSIRTSTLMGVSDPALITTFRRAGIRNRRPFSSLTLGWHRVDACRPRFPQSHGCNPIADFDIDG